MQADVAGAGVGAVDRPAWSAGAAHVDHHDLAGRSVTDHAVDNAIAATAQ